MAETGSPVGKDGSKWQLALAVGFPVAVGVCYWYLNSKYKRGNLKELDNKPSNQNREVLTNDVSAKSTSKPQSKTALELAVELKEEGNKKFKNAKFEEAIASYEKAINICPEKEKISLATFYQNKAAAYEQLKKYEDVIEACTKALSYNPTYTKALLRRAKACEETKDLPQALEDVIATCILENFQSHPNLISADRILKELGHQHAKEAMAKKVPVMPSETFIKTYFMAYVNDPINSFLTESEGDCSKGFLKAVDCFKKQAYGSVIAACTEEINLTEAEAIYKNEALVLRATFHKLSGDSNLAMSDLDIVINNSEASPRLRSNALIKRALIHMQLENIQGCLDDFNQAIAVDESNCDIYHHMGQIHFVLEKIQEALDDFKMAVALNPKNPLTIVHKCYTEYRLAIMAKDTDSVNKKLKQFEEIIKVFPDCTECYALYAQVLIESQQFNKADDLFQKAIKLDPKNAVLLVRKAMLTLQWTGDVETAVNNIKEALVIDDKCEFAYETLGTIEVQRGNLSKAIDMFDKALALTKTELEMTHIFSLKDAALAQKKVAEKLNMKMPRDLFNT